MAENKRLLILGKSGGNGVQVQSDGQKLTPNQ